MHNHPLPTRQLTAAPSAPRRWANTQRRLCAALATLTCALATLAPMALPSTTWAQSAPTATTAALPTRFDPARDAAQDLKLALQLAKASGKRVMVDVGGEWCSWCHVLDAYFANTPAVQAVLSQRYVMLKINWSPQNKNEAVLSQWPKVKGYPHLFVLASDGRLLHSQDTGDLELPATQGKGYDTVKMLAFLKRAASAP